MGGKPSSLASSAFFPSRSLTTSSCATTSRRPRRLRRCIAPSFLERRPRRRRFVLVLFGAAGAWADSGGTQAGKRTTDLKNQLSDLQGLKKAAGDVMRMHRECEDVARDIVRLESELSASGSTATSDDIQAQLAELNDQV